MLGLIADADEVLRAESIRFEFLIATVAAYEGRAGVVRKTCEIAAPCKDADGGRADARSVDCVCWRTG